MMSLRPGTIAEPIPEKAILSGKLVGIDLGASKILGFAPDEEGKARARRKEATRLRRRGAIAARSRKRLSGLGDLLLPPPEPEGSRAAWHFFVVHGGRRERLRAHLAMRGIRAGVHDPLAPHLQRALRPLGHRAGEFPVPERLSREVLSLPIPPELSGGRVDLVGEDVASFFGGGPP